MDKLRELKGNGANISPKNIWDCVRDSMHNTQLREALVGLHKAYAEAEAVMPIVEPPRVGVPGVYVPRS